MILRLVSGDRELLIDNKRRMMKYYGKAGDFRDPSSDVHTVLSGGVVPSPEEKKWDASSIFLSWDEFVRRL